MGWYDEGGHYHDPDLSGMEGCSISWWIIILGLLILGTELYYGC